MRVYIPFNDGSSVSFDGENFTVYKTPKDIDAPDKPGLDEPSKAELAWSKKWSEIVRVLENAYKREEARKKAERAKRIYKPQ